MDELDLLQWPAMIVTLLAAWLVASTTKKRRDQGFWVFLVSNLLWVLWGIESETYALVILQIGLAFSNIRGVIKNRSGASAIQ
ncbi:hypothetical protein [Dokdonella sp.]|uniref:hypothetical protein n=1 Tax=Dokdonella sp. TaxID=2291710 RepID=UPI003C3D0FA9